MKNETTQDNQGRYAYSGLERIIHEKSRLVILTSLLSSPQGLSFNDLKRLCELTDGNLSRHLQALEKESLIEMQKSISHKRPLTICLLTDDGRQRFLDYLQELERLVADASASTSNHQGKSEQTPIWQKVVNA